MSFEKYKTAKITFNGKEYVFLIADSFFKRMKGLANIDSLPNGINGMFFKFNKYTRTGFTTRGMRFNIDILFLDEERNIVEKFENLKPGIWKIQPTKKYKYVIETIPSLLI